MNRRYILSAMVLVLGSLLAADTAMARGGGGRGGGGRGGGGGMKKGGGAKVTNKSAQKGPAKDLEALRERLRQSDYRDHDASRDRPVV